MSFMDSLDRIGQELGLGSSELIAAAVVILIIIFSLGSRVMQERRKNAVFQQLLADHGIVHFGSYAY